MSRQIPIKSYFKEYPSFEKLQDWLWDRDIQGKIMWYEMLCYHSVAVNQIVFLKYINQNVEEIRCLDCDKRLSITNEGRLV